jgi:hypothetical protein
MTEPKVTIEESAFSMDELIERLDLSSNVAEEVRAAELVMIPITDFREFGAPLFPNLSEEAYAFMRRNNPDGIKLGVCIDDTNYQELILHHSVLHVATWVGEKVFLPSLVKWIVGFAKKKWGDSGKTEVEFRMILTDERREIEYKGPANQMEIVLLEAIRSLGKNHEG